MTRLSGQSHHPEPLESRCAAHIYQAFVNYNDDFRAITRRAKRNFETCDWHTAHRDGVERIELYDIWVDRTVHQLTELLGELRNDLRSWQRIKSLYSGIIGKDADKEFTKTFFSSITRRLFATVGVNASIEFIAIDARPLSEIATEARVRTYGDFTSLAETVGQLLADFAFSVPFAALSDDVEYICDKVRQRLQQAGDGTHAAELLQIETIEAVFYQGTRAYIVGRIITDRETLPLVFALRNEAGLRLDALMLYADEVSILFGFARTYFHVDLETVIDAVAFLLTIIPAKPVSELYTMLGRAKQGKTERYRSFFQHLAQSQDRFVAAAGQKGMVMAVFTLPSYDIVFKVIRDRFAPPKNTTRQHVIDSYQLVFKHDRAGRLIDAQEFKKLRFARDRFEPGLLEELMSEASETCQMAGDDLVIEHCYVERRMTPLDIYLRSSEKPKAVRAVIDYGQAIRDLAHSNIFPGDLLLKNFGVSRHGRVIFYDYDELCLLEDCKFRDLPQARTPEEEMEAGAWFYVADNDVFPEQFANFLGFEPDLRDVFLKHHRCLLEAAYWRDVQTRIRNGEVMEVLPYRPR